MKHFISIVALLAASAAVALAQPPSGAGKKQAQAAQVVKTTTTTYDTIALPTAEAVVAANDSLINARFDQIQEQIKELKNETRNTVRREVRNLQSDTGRIGNFLVRLLQNSIPLMPFVAGVLIAIFWFRYSYKRRVMRQEMIYKYIDRGEQVPEWLTRSENLAEPMATNDAGVPSKKNAKLFLVLAIIAAAITLIWFIALTSTHNWRGIATAMLACGAFGFATVYCFRQYLKRSE